ncbi:MAG: hypothetical protein V4494_04405 [Chlamydiota bacterium]
MDRIDDNLLNTATAVILGAFCLSAPRMLEIATEQGLDRLETQEWIEVFSAGDSMQVMDKMSHMRMRRRARAEQETTPTILLVQLLADQGINKEEPSACKIALRGLARVWVPFLAEAGITDWAEEFFKRHILKKMPAEDQNHQ